jgi:di/tricarboxylate transporter
MTFDQVVALAVLVAVVGALIWGRFRADAVALAGAATLLGTGVVRPTETQAAFASPALIALASLFVIAYAMELSGLLGAVIRLAVRLCRRLGSLGVWLVILLCGGASAFLNNTPIVVLGAPVVRDISRSLGLSPKRFLIPLSYATVLGGCCTLIGTSTNLLVNDMARNAGQPGFSLFEITPVAVVLAAVGGVYMLVFGRAILERGEAKPHLLEDPTGKAETARTGDAALGDLNLFAAADRPLDPRRAVLSLVVFVGVVLVAGLGYEPIAASAFTGAVLLIVLRVISLEDAYRGLRPDILLLIAGMVVVGLALQLSGLANRGTAVLMQLVQGLGPMTALVLLYGATLVLTEALSNAAVAVLMTPLAVALADSLAVSPKPFLAAVMLAASAAFATPFGYQTNVLVYQMGGYRYLDFVRIGLPLNLLTWGAAMVAIPRFFPF